MTSGFVLPHPSQQPRCRLDKPNHHRRALPKRALLSDNENDDKTILQPQSRRRQVLQQGLCTILTALTIPMSEAQAGIDPSALKSLRVEGDDTGGATRLRQLQATQQVEAESDLVEKPWEELSSGVSFREYRQGKGETGTCQDNKQQNPQISSMLSRGWWLARKLCS